ncbi:MAG TPA: hypothetical protein PLP05_01775, partial [Sedimentisphaerales bacterium]|nr:hypothetical protein [Sedimentisphaerales bacterium]
MFDADGRDIGLSKKKHFLLTIVGLSCTIMIDGERTITPNTRMSLYIKREIIKMARITLCLVVIFAMTLSVQAEDFKLKETQHLDVTSSYIYGYLYDFSTADILAYVYGLRTHDNSTANISRGSVSNLHAYDTSTVNLSRGSVERFYAYNSSTVNISGGSVNYLSVCDLRLNGPQR